MQATILNSHLLIILEKIYITIGDAKSCQLHSHLSMDDDDMASFDDQTAKKVGEWTN